MQVAAYRNGSTYQLWTLHRLAKKPDCQRSLIEEDAIATLVPLLTDEQLAVGSASILQTLASKEGAETLLNAGKPSVGQFIRACAAQACCTRALQPLH